MIDNLYDPKFWIIFFLLMYVIYIHNRITRLDAYKLGIRHGFIFGIECTAETMLDEQIVAKTNSSGFRVNKSELIKYLTPIMAKKLKTQLQ